MCSIDCPVHVFQFVLEYSDGSENIHSLNHQPNSKDLQIPRWSLHIWKNQSEHEIHLHQPSQIVGYLENLNFGDHGR